MTLQIFILGKLSQGEHHPYDIKKQVFKPLDNMITINDGTLYYNFEVLQKKGYIKKIKVTQTDNRPEKTTYGITDKGRKALEDEIYSVFQNYTSINSLYSSLLFLDHVDKQKLAYIIEELIAKLNMKIQHIESIDTSLIQIPEKAKPPVMLIAEHANHTMKNDLEWLQKLLAFVRNGG